MSAGIKDRFASAFAIAVAVVTLDDGSRRVAFTIGGAARALAPHDARGLASKMDDALKDAAADSPLELGHAGKSVCLTCEEFALVARALRQAAEEIEPQWGVS